MLRYVTRGFGVNGSFLPWEWGEHFIRRLSHCIENVTYGFVAAPSDEKSESKHELRNRRSRMLRYVTRGFGVNGSFLSWGWGEHFIRRLSHCIANVTYGFVAAPSDEKSERKHELRNRRSRMLRYVTRGFGVNGSFLSWEWGEHFIRRLSHCIANVTYGFVAAPSDEKSASKHELRNRRSRMLRYVTRGFGVNGSFLSWEWGEHFIRRLSHCIANVTYGFVAALPEIKREVSA